MKKKLVKQLLQIPLRFHHQDIHEELSSLNQKLDKIILLLDKSIEQNNERLKQ